MLNYIATDSQVQITFLICVLLALAVIAFAIGNRRRDMMKLTQIEMQQQHQLRVADKNKELGLLEGKALVPVNTQG